MNRFLIALVVCLFLSSPLLANPPAVTALQAAQIAQADLESRGLQNRIYIEQILLKKDGLIKGDPYWEVMWNDEFPAQTEGRKEFGLRIFMDGSHKRAIR